MKRCCSTPQIPPQVRRRLHSDDAHSIGGAAGNRGNGHCSQLNFQIQRDREEEMIHRGVQYSRAIKKYFKKFGRYPTSLNDLENTNNLRFLRKRYKDPITGKDFKLLHYSEVQMMSMGAGMRARRRSPPWLELECRERTPVPLAGFSLGPGGTQTSTGQTQTGRTGERSSGLQFEHEFVGRSKRIEQLIAAAPDYRRTDRRRDQYQQGEEHPRIWRQESLQQWQFIYNPGMQGIGLINTPAQPLTQGMACEP